MSSKTKIVVLHVKELIYTGIFAVLGILFIVLLIIMFLPKEEKRATMSTVTQTTSNTYIPGVYTTSLILNDNIVEIEVTVDEKNINSIRLINLDEAVATMYPLIQPSFEDLANQIIVNQSLDGITYSDDSKYTSMILWRRRWKMRGMRSWRRFNKQVAPDRISLSGAALQFLYLLQPDSGAGVRGHSQVAARGDSHTADFGTIRQTGTFKLLRKKSLVKSFEPL